MASGGASRRTPHYRRHHWRAAALLLTGILLSGLPAAADPPPGNCDPVDAASGQALRKTLHKVIDDHTRFPYTSSTRTDTWDVLEKADEDPENQDRVLDIYRNASYAKACGGNSSYYRERSRPKSYGFPDDHRGNYPFTEGRVGSARGVQRGMLEERRSS